MAAKKQASGGARIKASGKRAVLIGLPPDEYDFLRSVADSERRPLTQFLVHHALLAAEKISGKKFQKRDIKP